MQIPDLALDEVMVLEEGAHVGRQGGENQGLPFGAFLGVAAVVEADEALLAVKGRGMLVNGEGECVVPK